MAIIAKNPIMPGFYPDPSICAVGEDYYLVNSTFAYFPGLSIMHSKDLAHWEQIGNVMDRNSQLPLQGCEHSQGLFAPTIRYHEGTFYVICTNVSGGGNYIVTAEKPEGPWSEPVYLKDAVGIDPSLFFDEDGRCYYIGTRPNPAGCKYGGDWYIWVQELDLQEMKLVGEPMDVWNGAMRNIIWPEGPHLYKKDGYYYIMHAEGGTGPHHAVAVCRSRNIFGPYENNFCNPILTHRHLGKEYPVKYVGHADMIETPAGEWYMVMLAVRPTDGYTTLGRETFLAKVVWEDGWPVVNPSVGMLTDTVEINLPEWIPTAGGKNALPGTDREYDFGQMKELGDEFLYLRNPDKSLYMLEAERGLGIRFGKSSLKELDSPSFVSIRQQHHKFSTTIRLSLEELSDTARAGIALVQSNEYMLRIELSNRKAEAVLCEKGIDNIIGACEITGSEIMVFLRVNGLKAVAGINLDGKEKVIAEDISICGLSTEVAGGFVGCTVGMYAVTESLEEDGVAYFREFTYQQNV